VRAFRWVVIALAAMMALTALACGGDDDDDTVLPGTEVITEDLPAAFPDDFPIFEGASFRTGGTVEEGGVEIITAIWETSADIDDVKEFYDDELAGDGPWTATDDFSVEDATTWSISNDDGTPASLVVVADEEGTLITATIGEDFPLDGGD
jgi:hypothetical protein